ncbi:MAG TPA: hypothetical protein VE860_12580 [Chthoniobacterales bacterium]|jgi:nucleoside-diphosphate-sugar epimerase|nr:hypothetical protein [Chthoniobacterales bacterium]
MIIVTGGSGKAGRGLYLAMLAHHYEVASVDLVRDFFRVVSNRMTSPIALPVLTHA